MSVDVDTAVQWYRRSRPGGTVEAAIRSYEQSLRLSREAKRRRQGKCVDCGATTRYSGHGGQVSERCRACAPAYRQFWTREALIEAIHLYADRYGRQPTARDWNPAMAIRGFRDDIAERFYEDGIWPNTSTVVNVFGSWNAAILASGFEPLRAGHKHSDHSRRDA